jgi:hypothetical protein
MEEKIQEKERGNNEEKETAPSWCYGSEKGTPQNGNTE